MTEECELKVKIELINDGFLVFGPSGTQFRESLIEAVDIATEELYNFATDAFRILEDDVEEFNKVMEIRKKADKLAHEIVRNVTQKSEEKAEQWADSPEGRGKIARMEKLANEEKERLAL
jgi:hypothetical protein